MTRTRVVLSFLAVAVAGLFLWGFTRKTSPPEIPFTKAARATIVSSLSTNGKIEPIEWASARAERQGVVQKIFVVRGQEVKPGQQMVTLDVGAIGNELATARADITSAQAQQQILKQGGPQLERTQIENQIGAAQSNLKNERKEYESLQRLVNKQAATRVELDASRQRVEQFQLEIQSLERRRAALVAPTDLPVSQARLDQAQSAASSAQRNLSLSIVRAPMAGTLYQFELRLGSFLNAGDLVGNMGRLDQVRVMVYVDEPDLGRVDKGMPVTITWDAVPGRKWKGAVDKLPTQVVALGSRQVGEVGCVIENPGHDLLPGTNINAEIQSRVVQNALSIPKEALRREGDVTGVFLLSGEKIVWRPLKLGVSSYTKAQVLEGLAEGDSITLPTDRAVKDGLKVKAIYP